MKRLFMIIFLITVFIFDLLLDNTCFSQQNRVHVEAWEKRHNRLQPPVEIMDAIGLKEGMTVADIGAGTGRFTVWFADRVGSTGHVFANDIDKRALRSLERRCKKYNIENVIIIQGEIENPSLPQDTLDIAFMINVYHHLEKPVALLRNIIPSLKSNGILAIAERDPEKSNGTSHDSTSREKMIAELDEAGFEVVRIETFLQEHNIYFSKPKKMVDI